MRGQHSERVILDEIDAVTPEAMLEEASSALQRLVQPPVEPEIRWIPCPFCTGGISVSQYSFLWGHTCWICAGWAVVRADRQYLLGPIAPHPSRKMM